MLLLFFYFFIFLTYRKQSVRKQQKKDTQVMIGLLDGIGFMFSHQFSLCQIDSRKLISLKVFRICMFLTVVVKRHLLSPNEYAKMVAYLVWLCFFFFFVDNNLVSSWLLEMNNSPLRKTYKMYKNLVANLFNI